MRRRSNGNAIVRTRPKIRKKKSALDKRTYIKKYIYVTVPGSFYEQARKAIYSPARSNKVSGKPPATLPPLMQIEWKGKRRSCVRS